MYVKCQDAADGGAMQGAYRDQYGSVSDGILTLFPSVHERQAVTQEFGTFPGILVLLQLIRENAATHHVPTMRNSVSQDLLGIFYVDKCDWKNTVLDRGQQLFWAVVSGKY